MDLIQKEPPQQPLNLLFYWSDRQKIYISLWSYVESSNEHVLSVGLLEAVGAQGKNSQWGPSTVIHHVLLSICHANKKFAKSKPFILLPLFKLVDFLNMYNMRKPKQYNQTIVPL